jgi:putative flippase GtrA
MKLTDRSIVRFPIVGLINTFIGLLVIYLAKYSGIDDVASNLIGYSVGLCISFFLNRKWTFSHGGSILPTVLKFSVVTMLAYIANLLVVIFLLDEIGLNSFLAQAAAVPVYAVMTYVGYRWFVFPEKTNGL